MSVVLVATAFPVPEHRAEVIAACEAAITRVHDEPGVELYALYEGPDRVVMVEKYEEALAEHSNGAALADLLSALEGKLSRDLDVQVLVPRPTGRTRRRVRCDRSPVSHRRCWLSIWASRPTKRCDASCAGAGEALREHRQGRPQLRQPIFCPAPLPGLAAHPQPHSGGRA
jgi:quinol monooxygenase YgiN